jgi:chorismate mutase
MKKIFALRGATQCLNTQDDIIAQIAAVYDALLADNKLSEDDIVSLIFSITDDLDAINPAAALRRAGRGADIVLFSTQEPKSINAFKRTVRLLLHCYMEEGSIPQHSYRNGAEALRPDRAARQGQTN